MSEDVDFKIQPKSSAKGLSRSKHNRALKSLRAEIVAITESMGFKKTDNGIVRNEGKYFQIKLDYPSQFSAIAILKPHILLEFTESNLRLPTENRIVKTLVQETFKTLLPHLDEINVSCISVKETAAEKWVALTRRIVAIERGRFSDDLSLIRHVYDLMIINEAGVLESNFCRLANNSIKQDADQFKNQHPEYFHNHTHEIMRSIEILTQTKWETRYHDFIEAMVYDSKPAASYADALKNLTVLTTRVLKV